MERIIAGAGKNESGRLCTSSAGCILGGYGVVIDQRGIEKSVTGKLPYAGAGCSCGSKNIYMATCSVGNGNSAISIGSTGKGDTAIAVACNSLNGQFH